MRGYIGTHRNDIDASAQYLGYEDVFLRIAEGDEGGKDELIFHLDTIYQTLLENFMQVRNNANLWGKCDVDLQGKTTIFEPETGRPRVIWVLL